MNRKILAVTGVAGMLLVSSAPAWALGEIWKRPPPGDRTVVAAPEIDVNAGTKGIAVLVAGLLLVGEGLRRRR